MILDRIENASMYASINANLQKGFDFLTQPDLISLVNGRHDIEGNEVFALVSEYDSKEHADCRLEAHRTYTDIQYIVSGREAIGYASLGAQEILVEFNADKDIVFFTGDTTPLNLEAGMFAVFFPQDVHRPCMQINGPEKVKKIVVKVKI